jgi:hypothetical protein
MLKLQESCSKERQEFSEQSAPTRGIPKSLADSKKRKRVDTVIREGMFFCTSGRIRGKFA